MPNQQFYLDLEIAKSAESTVLSTFSALAPTYQFTDVSGDRSYWHKGDILATAPDGHTVCIEVKQDGRIASTGNILCEDAVYYNDGGLRDGNMHSDYEIYCVVSPQARKIVVIDFDVLRRNYKQGQYKVIPHPTQTTYCYLLPLTTVKALGGIIAVLDY